MKKLIAAIFIALSSLAQADTAGSMNNKAGGMLVLTDVLCKDKGGYIMYSSANGSRTLFGCWFSDDTMVHVQWHDGDVRSYPFNIFRLYLDVLKRMKTKKAPGLDL